jgi:hypothetical protein
MSGAAWPLPASPEAASVLKKVFPRRLVERQPGLSRQAEWRRGEVGVIRHRAVKARMWATAIVRNEKPADQGARLAGAFIGLEINLFIFDAAPEPLDKDVVAPPPLLSRLIAMLAVNSAPVKAAAVNCEPWSVLKISDLPCLANAPSRTSTQNAAFMVFDTAHARTRRLAQSSTAAR